MQDRLYSNKQKAPAVINRSSRVVSTADRPVKPHDGGDCPVDFLCGFFFVRLDVSGGVGADEDVVHHPPQHRVAAVGNPFFQHQLHQFLGRRGHILKALTKGNHRKAHALKVLHHLHSAPSVKGDLTNIEPFTQLLNEFFNVAVVDHISLGGHQRPLALPQVIGNMVTADTQVKGLLRYPEVRQNVVFVILVQWRKHQHKGCDVRGRG